MLVKTIDDLSKRTGPITAKVTVEGDDPEVVTSKIAKDIAIDKASQLGLGTCGISGSSGAYPIDDKGEVINLEKPEDVIRMQQITKLYGTYKPKYRNDYEILQAAIRS